MLSQEMLILDHLRSRSYAGLQGLGAVRHLRYLFQNDRVVHGVGRVGAPGEGAVVRAEHARDVHRVLTLEGLDDDKAGVLLVLAVNLLCGQASGAGNLAVEVVRVGGSVAGDAASGLGQEVAHGEWVWTTPPIFGNAL